MNKPQLVMFNLPMMLLEPTEFSHNNRGLLL
jgi:hypothetical protein